MRKVLIIWEEIPETTRFFALPASDEEYEKLVKCHGKFINSDEMTPELEWLNEMILEAEDYEIKTKPNDPIQLHDATTVIWTGFIL
jgi:hypothetical protein